jgi:hypothetical protein
MQQRWPLGKAKLWVACLVIIATIFGSIQLYAALTARGTASEEGADAVVVRTIVRAGALLSEPQTQREKFNPHISYEAFGIIPELCNADASSEGSIGAELGENVVHTISAVIPAGTIAPYRVHLCVAKHDHFHTINLKFKGNKNAVATSKCRAMLSCQEPLPDALHWDWRVADRPLAIHTYSPEFLTSDGVFISIYHDSTGTGQVEQDQDQDCSMELLLEETLHKDVLKKSSLRGNGQVPLSHKGKHAGQY